MLKNKRLSTFGHLFFALIVLLLISMSSCSRLTDLMISNKVQVKKQQNPPTNATMDLKKKILLLKNDKMIEKLFDLIDTNGSIIFSIFFVVNINLLNSLISLGDGKLSFQELHDFLNYS